MAAGANAQNDFGMFRQLCGTDGNVVFSPKSVQAILALTANGAKGNTSTEILDAVGYEGLCLNAVNRANREFAARIGTLDPSVTVRSANALWLPADLTLRCAFRNKARKFYDATTGPLDVDAINGWCDQKTDHLIPKILDQLNGNERMILTNALYFKGQWKSPFEPAFTSDQLFHNASGADTKVPTMHKTEYFGYCDCGDFAVAELLYGNGSFCIDIILPAEGRNAGEVLADIDDKRWEETLGCIQPTNLALSLPRFEIEFDTRLNDMLQSQGMQQAFTPAADFSKLCRNEALMVDIVKQKAYVKLDEQGTEAAAVTAVMMTKAVGPSHTTKFKVDRPFFFVIREVKAGTALFMGKVEEL